MSSQYAGKIIALPVPAVSPAMNSLKENGEMFARCARILRFLIEPMDATKHGS